MYPDRTEFALPKLSTRLEEEENRSWPDCSTLTGLALEVAPNLGALSNNGHWFENET